MNQHFSKRLANYNIKVIKLLSDKLLITYKDLMFLIESYEYDDDSFTEHLKEQELLRMEMSKIIKQLEIVSECDKDRV